MWKQGWIINIHRTLLQMFTIHSSKHVCHHISSIKKKSQYTWIQWTSLDPIAERLSHGLLPKSIESISLMPYQRSQGENSFAWIVRVYITNGVILHVPYGSWITLVTIWLLMTFRLPTRLFTLHRWILDFHFTLHFPI